jgi:hypothetical protein
MSSKCDVCGAEARIYLSDGKGGTTARYCLDCHNVIMAENYGQELPEDMAKRIWIVDSRGIERSFEVELMLFGHANKLEANEIGDSKYRCVVYGDPDEPFAKLWNKLLSRLTKAVNTTYLEEDGWIKNERAVGYIEYNDATDGHDIIIDGRCFSMDELEKNLAGREGFQIKIEFADSTDDIE